MKQLAQIIKCFVRPHFANSSQAHIRFIKLLWRPPTDDIHIYAPFFLTVPSGKHSPEREGKEEEEE